MKPPVLTKLDFYRRFHRGEFGNHGPMWETFAEWQQSGYKDLIAIRVKQAGGRCDYNLRPEEVADRVESFRDSGYSDSNMQFSAMAPTAKTVVQGEIGLVNFSPELFFSRAKLPMRDALASAGEHASGLEAICILQAACDPSSFDWIANLLTEYHNATIEFSTFSVPWGVVPGHNTVIWEVRNY